MSTRLSLACISVIFISLSLAGTSHAGIDLGDALAIWLFDEGDGDVCEDFSGNGHDGIFTGNVQWDAGRFGDALVFDGVGSYVNAGEVQLTENSFTVTLWVYMPEVPVGWVHVVENGSLEHGDWYGSFRLEPGAEEGRFYVSLGDNVQSVDNGANGQLIGWKTRKWEHLAVTYDGSRCSIYLNGNEVDGFNTDADVTQGFGSVIMGCMAQKSRFYNGMIDEFTIFGPALSADDINLIMTRGIVVLSPVLPAGKLVSTWSHIKSLSENRRLSMAKPVSKSGFRIGSKSYSKDF